MALHCEEVVRGEDKWFGFFDFGFAQIPQVPPALQYLQALQLLQAAQGE